MSPCPVPHSDLRVYENKYYEPDHEEEVEYEDEVDYSDGGRVVFDTGSRYGGIDLAAALGLTGVGYVANSGGSSSHRRQEMRQETRCHCSALSCHR